MQIDDGLPDNFVVWNVEVDTVVSTQTSGAPVDLHDFGEAFANLQPVAHPKGPANLQLDAGDDSAEKVLPGKAENDSGDPRPGEKALELGFSVIAEAEDEKKSDEKNEEAKDSGKKGGVGGWRLLLEVEVQEKRVREGENEGG